MSGEFRYDIRVLQCGECGAPIQVSAQGGIVSCHYCSAQVNPSPRSEIDLTSPGITENDDRHHLEILRAQTKMQSLGWTHLLLLRNPAPVDPLHTRNKAELQLAEWKKHYANLQTSHTPKSESWLVTHASDLTEYYVHSDLRKTRALVETTLEQCRARHNIQLLRCSLARLAVRAGDPDSAKQWLRHCDPRSEALYMDLTYRVSLAAISIYLGDFSGVLVQLREQDDLWAPVAAIQRAHALEQLHGPRRGAEELHRCARVNPEGWDGLFSTRRLSPTLATGSFMQLPTLLSPWRPLLLSAAALAGLAGLLGLDRAITPRVLGSSLTGPLATPGAVLFAGLALLMLLLVRHVRRALRRRVAEPLTD